MLQIDVFMMACASSG